MSSEDCEVLVVGGGIHGVGVAQAAAAAGYRCTLVESRSLAAGTSSKSSKLIHGGLRYLETFDIRLVRESLLERELLLELAPHLVQRRPFIIPIYPKTSRRPWTLRAGLSLYAILSGLRKHTGFRRVPKREWNQLDGLTTRDLQHVFQYWDAQTDDRKLTEAVMQSAQSLGATLRCPAELVSANVDNEGCTAKIQVGGAHETIRTQVLVNAAGPWATRVAERIDPKPPKPHVDLVQGTHIEVGGTISRGCYYLEAPDDGRAVFVMPWHDRTLVGTTEVIHSGDPADAAATSGELNYLQNVFTHYFPGRSAEILEHWAGLRVLPASHESANRRTRETQLPVDQPERPRVLSIFGGKLTGYRATAEKVMNTIRPTLPERRRVADTRTLRLP